MGSLRIGVLLVVIVLSGCAPNVAKDPLAAQGGAEDGIVLLSITVNTGEVAAFETIDLYMKHGSKARPGLTQTYSMRNLLPGLARDTSLFVGTLPAGEYRFKQLNAGTKYLVINDKQSELIGSFKVEAGKVADLGRIVMTAVNFNVMVGRSAMVTANRELVAAASPKHATLYDRPAGGGWDAPRNSKDFVEEYGASRPQGAGGFSELSSGEVVGGTRMGAIVARSTTGRWRILGRTGKPDAVLYTAPYEVDGKVAVGVGELGTFVVVDAQGKVTPVARGNLPFGNYTFVDHAPDQSVWFVGVQRAERAQLFSSPRLDNGEWSLVREDSIQPDFWSGGRPVWWWRQTNGMGYASSAGKLVSCYDYSTGKWISSPPPGGKKLMAVAGGPGAAIGVLTGSNSGLGGIFSGTFISKDCGATWVETNSPYKVKVAPPIVLASGRILESGGTFGDKGIYGSADDGRTWEKVTSEVTVFGERLWAMPKAGLISVSLGSYGVEWIEHSADEGKTWKREVTTLDRSLLDKPPARPAADAAPPAAAPPPAQPAPATPAP